MCSAHWGLITSFTGSPSETPQSCRIMSRFCNPLHKCGRVRTSAKTSAAYLRRCVCDHRSAWHSFKVGICPWLLTGDSLWGHNEMLACQSRTTMSAWGSAVCMESLLVSLFFSSRRWALCNALVMKKQGTLNCFTMEKTEGQIPALWLPPCCLSLCRHVSQMLSGLY